MLKAKNQAGHLVCVLEDDELMGPFFCPICGRQLILKQGSHRRTHFAHKRLGDCQAYFETESAEHLDLKALLYTSICSKHLVKVEEYIGQNQQIADLLVEQRYAIEIQCSALGIDRLKERTVAYHQAGYQVFWLLGHKLWLKSKLTALQSHFLYFHEALGYYLWQIDVKKGELGLRYLLHENLFGELVYCSQNFDLQSIDLLDLLRHPEEYIVQKTLKLKNPEELTKRLVRALRQKQSKWLKRQEILYCQGKNLLTQDRSYFFPYYRPPLLYEGCCQSPDADRGYYYRFVRKEKQGRIQAYQFCRQPKDY